MHPVTKLLQEWARSQVEGLKQDWVEGLFTHEDVQAQAVLNAHALAQVAVFQMFVELDFNQFTEVSDGE